MLLCSATFVHAQAKQSLTFQATHASVQAKLFDNISDSCKPSPANDPSCNPLPRNTAAWRCPACNDTAQRACAESSAATRGFCAYAGMQSDGRPSDEHPLCPLTGKPAALSPPHSPSDAYVSVGAEFRCSPAFVSHRGRAQPCLKHLPPVPNLHSSRPLALRPQPARPHPTHTVQRHRATKPARAPLAPSSCFNSSKDPADRLCISRAYQRSVDCIAPADALPELLSRLLYWAERDYARSHGRAPQFQCFHRGGYGSVPWLHLHSFDGAQADSICPLEIGATHNGARGGA